MKRLKDVIARKRPAARSARADDRETIRDFSEVLGERRAPQGREKPARDAEQEELERRLMNGELPRSKPVEPIRRADVEMERLAPKDPPAPLDTYPERTAATSPAKKAPAAQKAPKAAPPAPKPPEPASSATPRVDPQIWDIEATPETSRDTPPQARPPARKKRAPGQRAAAGGRVKTRILGFHADDLPPDVFGGEARPATSSVRYPTGWLVLVDGPGRGHAFALAAGVSKIGRGADQTIPLDFGDTSISRDNHAAIAFDEEENRFFIGHGGKSNIVRLNGKPVLATEEMQDGDLVKIGTTTLRLVALCGPEFTWGARDGDNAEDA